MSPTFPPDVIERIIAHTAHQPTLFTLTLVNRFTHHLANPKLYHTVRLHTPQAWVKYFNFSTSGVDGKPATPINYKTFHLVTTVTGTKPSICLSLSDMLEDMLPIGEHFAHVEHFRWRHGAFVNPSSASTKEQGSTIDNDHDQTAQAFSLLNRDDWLIFQEFSFRGNTTTFDVHLDHLESFDFPKFTGWFYNPELEENRIYGIRYVGFDINTAREEWFGDWCPREYQSPVDDPRYVIGIGNAEIDSIQELAEDVKLLSGNLVEVSKADEKKDPDEWREWVLKRPWEIKGSR
ncbi:hypothetical protein CI109_106801 [Kwoniella shandongensis]|uniref:Uncharacterized protein n=1 Tax=Kwoniella shandongensis TaxID=1734106 RepID=A0A5M6CAG0_9TREE|nr:uncharacterized protein CI109_000942 [Kwoniella shandongensis]KAA5530762.1 hypothetical protein CI109_000942 [Kwoniella shandongensis]